MFHFDFAYVIINYRAFITAALLQPDKSHFVHKLQLWTNTFSRPPHRLKLATRIYMPWVMHINMFSWLVVVFYNLSIRLMFFVQLTTHRRGGVRQPTPSTASAAHKKKHGQERNANEKYGCNIFCYLSTASWKMSAVSFYSCRHVRKVSCY